MLVEAIELLVGGRADTTIVRHGADEARVDGRFVTADGGRARAQPGDRPQRALAGLRQRAPGDGGVARRGDRRSGRPARPARPPEPAVDGDATGRARPVRRVDLEPLRAARARLTEIDAELAALGGDERARAREIDLLRFQVDELDRAAVIDADEDARSTPRRRCSATPSASARRGAGRRPRSPTTAAPRDALAAGARARSTAAGRSPISPSGCTHVLAELDDVAADVRRTAESIDESPSASRRSASVGSC